MPRSRMKRARAHNFVTHSWQNINSSALDLASISHFSDEIERTGQNRNCSVRERRLPFKQLENVIEGDSNMPFWKQNVFSITKIDEFNGRNLIFTTGELNASWPHCGQYSNVQIQNASVIRPLSSPIQSPSLLSSSSQPQPPHRLSNGCSNMNQSEDKHPVAKDCSVNEQRKLTRRFFVTILSICYAIFLIVFGAIIFIGDVVNSEYPLPQIFCIYMLSIAFAYFLYLYADIRYHIYCAENQFKDHVQRTEQIDEYMKKERCSNSGNQFTCISSSDASSSSSDASYPQAMQSLNVPSPETILHRYCFISGRNGSSLYVKLGASWFAFGLLVYSALRISYDAFFISSYGNQLYECASFLALTINILFPLYVLLTLFFILKYMNVVINVNQNLARVFLFHAIGTSFSLWVYTIVHETADAIAESDDIDGRHHRRKCNKTFDFVYNDCGKSNSMNVINRQFAPYLYPFVIEYCILVVAICCKVYENIGHCTKKQHSLENSEREIEHKPFQASFRVYADCESSMSGFFCGLLFLISAIVCIILEFVGFQNRSCFVTSIILDRSFETSALFVLIVTTIIAYRQITNLDMKANTVLEMDDILLILTIPAFFVDFIFSLVPAYKNRTILQMCIAFLRVFDVLIQTTFIIDGQRRYVKKKCPHDKKPGRQIIIFLAIANMALWIHQTFSGRNLDAQDERFAYYGHRFWNILDHTCIPLIMFYRFHASVCLVDIWNHAYEPNEHHE